MVYLESSQGCEPVQVWSLGPAHIVSSNQGHYKPWGKSKQMFKISQSAVEQTVNSIRNGDSDEFVKQFFASRPEWQVWFATENVLAGDAYPVQQLACKACRKPALNMVASRF